MTDVVLDGRYRLAMQEYESLLRGSRCVRFGTRNVIIDREFLAGARRPGLHGKQLYLREIREFHREYEWV